MRSNSSFCRYARAPYGLGSTRAPRAWPTGRTLPDRLRLTPLIERCARSTVPASAVEQHTNVPAGFVGVGSG